MVLVLILLHCTTDAANRSDDPDSSGLPLSFPDQVQPSSVSVPPGGVAGARGDWLPAW